MADPVRLTLSIQEPATPGGAPPGSSAEVPFLVLEPGQTVKGRVRVDVLEDVDGLKSTSCVSTCSMGRLAKRVALTTSFITFPYFMSLPRGISMRYVLAISILLCVVGSIFKLVDLLSTMPAPWLQQGAMAATFGGMGLVVAIIMALFIMAIRYRHGQPVPDWVVSFLVTKDD